MWVLLAMRSAQAMSLPAATVQLSRAHCGDVQHFGVELPEDREFLQKGRTGTRQSVGGSAALRPAVRPRRWGRRRLLAEAIVRTNAARCFGPVQRDNTRPYYRQSMRDYSMNVKSKKVPR